MMGPSMMVGGEEWVTSEDEELERRLHPLLRRDEMSGKEGNLLLRTVKRFEGCLKSLLIFL
jgi:hypothetical protein